MFVLYYCFGHMQIFFAHSSSINYSSAIQRAKEVLDFVLRRCISAVYTEVE